MDRQVRRAVRIIEGLVPEGGLVIDSVAIPQLLGKGFALETAIEAIDVVKGKRWKPEYLTVKTLFQITG